jgi:hypothetical protein
VRIYRRGRTVPHRLVGIVEQGGLEGKRAFTCLDELWGILSPPGVRKGPGKSRKESQGLGENKPHNSKKIKKKGESHGPEKKL